MSRCVCELLGTRLQGPAHALHTDVERRLGEVAALATRYLPRRSVPSADSERDALITQTHERLKRLHQLGQASFPSLSARRSSESAMRQRLHRRDQDVPVE